MSHIKNFLILIVLILLFVNPAYSSSQQSEGLKPIPLANPPIFQKFTTSQNFQVMSAMQNETKSHAPVPEPPMPISNQTIQGPINGTQTNPISRLVPHRQFQVQGSLQLTSSSFEVFEESLLPQQTTPDPSGINSAEEPSVSTNGSTTFYTMNWEDYYYQNYGSSHWISKNPYADMPTFCCDQDTVYDPVNKIFIWVRQGNTDANGNNFDILQVSTDGINWSTPYDFSPSTLNSSWTNRSFDYPHLALSSKYLYMTTSIAQNDSIINVVILRFTLSDLSSGTFSPLYYDLSVSQTTTPVEGASGTMYFGTTFSNNMIRIWHISDSDLSNTLYHVDDTIPAWTGGHMSCPDPSGNNWCGFADNRVLGGWTTGNTIGFYWNVAQGNGFPYPYTYVSTFDTSTLNFVSTHLLWSSAGALLYSTISANSAGNLGLISFYGNSATYATMIAGIHDDLTTSNPYWEVYSIASGSTSTTANRWGDFIRVRDFIGTNIWIGTGFVQTNPSSPYDQPYMIIFGRERDTIDPNANAGNSQTVSGGSIVTLGGAGGDSYNKTVTCNWSQTSGPAVSISNANLCTTTFTAPIVSSNTNLGFQITASDGFATSNPSSVNILVQSSCSPPSSGDWTISSSCTISSAVTAPANVIVQSNSVLTIPNGLRLNIDFTHYHLLVKAGSGVLIKAGGAIN